MTTEGRKEPPKAHPEAQEPEDGNARPEAPSPEQSGRVSCDLCGAPMLERHCKLLCVRCGYQRDCSDP